jgi:LemA protein
MSFTYAVILCIVLLASIVIAIYNGLIRLRVRSEEAWSDIATQLKRRYDLIPNLVETVKGYAAHERGTFDEVTKARSAAMNAGTVEDKAKAENILTSTLKSLFAVAENYPDLKANQNFLQLQGTLTEIEDKLQLSRRYYNSVVRDLNTKIAMFPSNIVANMFSFTAKEFFELGSEEEGKNVKVSF